MSERLEVPGFRIAGTILTDGRNRAGKREYRRFATRRESRNGRNSRTGTKIRGFEISRLRPSRSRHAGRLGLVVVRAWGANRLSGVFRAGLSKRRSLQARILRHEPRGRPIQSRHGRARKRRMRKRVPPPDERRIRVRRDVGRLKCGKEREPRDQRNRRRRLFRPILQNPQEYRGEREKRRILGVGIRGRGRGRIFHPHEFAGARFRLVPFARTQVPLHQKCRARRIGGSRRVWRPCEKCEIPIPLVRRTGYRTG